MHRLALVTALFMCAPVAAANSDFVSGRVSDHFTTQTHHVPVSQTECSTKRVPIYANSTRPESPNFGEIVVGAAIGSAVGNAISDKDGVGTLGGIVGAHTAMKNGSNREQVIVGYERVEECVPVTTYQAETVQKYSYSILEFELDGRIHRVRFQR